MAAVSADKFEFDVCMPTYDYVFQPDVLRNKVAFITGGGSGICFTIAEVFMRHQCQTVIASRNLQRVQVAAKKLEKATGQQCLPLQLDVRKPQDVMKGVDAALGHFGKIDILINGAAGNFLVPASGLSYNGFRTVMDIDAMGTYNTSKAVYDKYMNKHGGVIMNISATLAYRGQMFQLHAAAAKAAIDSMTRTLCNEWGPQGIRVVGIAPGPIGDTEGMRRLGGGFLGKEGLDKLAQNLPLQRVGTKCDIADCAVFLASPAASYISGHTVVVDGGSWMTDDNNIEAMAKRVDNAKL
ncbi:peroxisomal 2,4-dienoyl-CoA reductase-like isoform X2 [Acanthaster planci]|uniref:Peroxisomal 2,4-dienoyl-CoA reductase [(3E)-enoyl-CoA-producing] n=1 Tax=Acanthaster planci TaxID=133434 RepID=A0A8B7YHI0_ACAPL|nr:peroxisomal 2,4-dienoyl-CoA reductase-like isoform X2 [Acanthaster planci]